MNRCRFCKNDSQSQLVKYEVRHYAHAKCLIEAKGAAAFDYFTAWQLEAQFPYMPVVKAGLVEEFHNALDAARARTPYGL